MNKAFFYSVLFGMGLLQQGKAQINLIFNGDFELYDTCPSSVSTSGDFQIERCVGWYAPTLGTSDYFNICSGTIVGIPNNTMGYQVPFSGNAYCGVLFENQAPPFVWTGFWTEYIQSKLISVLEEYHEYEFSCKIVMSKVLHEYSLSKFGALFTSTGIFRSDAKPFETVPQILNSRGNYFTDTLDWIEIKQRFYAKGNEEFVTIGFFVDTLNLDTLRNTTGAIDPNHFGAYYYIDDCKLVSTGNVFTMSNVFSPNGDNINDFWFPEIFEEGDCIKIFNRWGREVYTIISKEQPWHGQSANGQESSNGIYYYSYINKDKHGFIQLVR